jgi:hypothetical protein
VAITHLPPPKSSGPQNAWKERHVIEKTLQAVVSHGMVQAGSLCLHPYASKKPGWSSLGGPRENDGKRG